MVGRPKVEMVNVQGSWVQSVVRGSGSRVLYHCMHTAWEIDAESLVLQFVFSV